MVYMHDVVYNYCVYYKQYIVCFPTAIIRHNINIEIPLSTPT
jgi:hypothetical protein